MADNTEKTTRKRHKDANTDCIDAGIDFLREVRKGCVNMADSSGAFTVSLDWSKVYEGVVENMQVKQPG